MPISRWHAQRPFPAPEAGESLQAVLIERLNTMHGCASETNSRHVGLCAQAQHEPVSAKKAGSIASEIPHAKQRQATQGAREKVFEAEFGDWLVSQNIRFEAIGVPGADLRPW